MLSSLAFAAVAADTLILRRGVNLEGSPLGRYWDVQEAQIDAEAPGLPIPTSFGLSGDAKRSILIRFGSLDLAVGEGKEITDATIKFKLSDPEKAGITGVRLMKRPWLWPGVQALSKRIKAPVAGAEVPFAPGVTWSKAGGDTGNWQTPGALGVEDSEKLNAKIEVKGDTVTISGLGSTLQYLKSHEGLNFGFLIECSAKTEVWSSLSPTDQPELHLNLAAKPSKSAKTWLTKNGDKITLNSDQPISAYRVFGGTQVSSFTTIQGGATEVELKLPSPSRSRDSRNSIYRVVPTFGDAAIATNPILIDPNGTWLEVSPDTSRAWNLNAVDASTYSFAPIGATKHINPLGKQDQVDLLKRLIPQDAPDENLTDISLLAALVPPARPTNEPLFKQLARPETGPLTMFQVDRLMNPTVAYPGVIILRAVTPEGDPLVGAKLRFANQPEMVTDKSGYAFPASPEPGFVGSIAVSAEIHGAKDSFIFSSAKLSNIYARGMTKAASIELPFNLPASEITRDNNLVLGKPTRDSAGSFPAQLLGLTDDNDGTTFTLSPKAWVEVDLGRDRLLGELELRGEVPQAFLVAVYGTTEKVNDSRPWISEANLSDRLRYYPSTDPNSTLYRPKPMGGRYLRILNAGDKPATLKGIRVFATKRGA